MFDSAAFAVVAAAVQSVGTVVLALMMARLAKIFVSEYVRQWARGWATMFLALVCMGIADKTESRVWWIGFLVAEWTFLFLLYDGCRQVVDRTSVNRRHGIYAVPVTLAMALISAHLTPSRDVLMIGGSAVLAVGFLLSFRVLSRMRPADRHTGWHTLRGALAITGVMYAIYVVFYWLQATRGSMSFVGYAALAELLAFVLLSFSMILVAADDARLALTEALSEQQSAHNTLEQQLHIDPLTEALNRHAFYWMQRGEEIATEGVLSGTVMVVDIDGLKGINDKYGHAVGDQIIRAAANAIRARVRADDLIFRWGGDEFVAILPNLSSDVVQSRFRSLADGIRTPLPSGHELMLHLSWGAAEFGADRALDAAMQAADAEMYEKRLSRRVTPLRQVRS